LNQQPDLTRLLLGIRRGAIVLILLLGYLYFKLAGEAYALVSIGLISFAAVAQFAPAVLGGIFWKGGTRKGALAGLVAGFGVSLAGAPGVDEHRQASLFVDVFRQGGEGGGARFWRGTASAPELYHLLARFLGIAAAEEAFRSFAAARGKRWPEDPLEADAELV